MSNVMFLNTENECFDESYVRHLSDFLQVSDLYDQQDIGENGSQISGGQKQRVSLIRSLCSNKPITILDEPTSALDLNSEIKLIKALEIQRTNLGKSFIIISHSPHVLAACDKVYELKEGNLVLV